MHWPWNYQYRNNARNNAFVFSWYFAFFFSYLAVLRFIIELGSEYTWLALTTGIAIFEHSIRKKREISNYQRWRSLSDCTQATISHLINLTDQLVLFRNDDRDHTYVEHPIIRSYISTRARCYKSDPAAVVCYKTQFAYLLQPLFRLLNKVRATSVGVH